MVILPETAKLLNHDCALINFTLAVMVDYTYLHNLFSKNDVVYL